MWETTNGESTGKTEAASKPAPGDRRVRSGGRDPRAGTVSRAYHGAMTSSAASHPRERRVSQRIGSIAESATLKVDAKAKALKAEGRPVIGFGAGEPDFPTPDYIVDAAVEACRDPKNHRYTPAGGLPELKKAIAEKTLRDSGSRSSPSPGAGDQRRQAGDLRGLRRDARPGRRGDRAGAVLDDVPRGDPARRRRPVEVLADETQDYKVTVEQLEAARTEKTKVLLFVSPSNPTGSVYTVRRDPRDRRVGRGPRAVGADRRDLRAPGLRRRRTPGRCRCCAPGSRTTASSSTASPRPTR